MKFSSILSYYIRHFSLRRDIGDEEHHLFHW